MNCRAACKSRTYCSMGFNSCHISQTSALATIAIAGIWEEPMEFNSTTMTTRVLCYSGKMKREVLRIHDRIAGWNTAAMYERLQKWTSRCFRRRSCYCCCYSYCCNLVKDSCQRDRCY